MDRPKLSKEYWQKLADTEPYGLKLTPEIVQSWFDHVWPQYSERRYTAHRRAIASWWSRVWESDIERAIERLQRIEERETIAVMEARLPKPLTNEEIPDFTLKIVRNE